MRLLTLGLIVILTIIIVGCSCEETQDDDDTTVPPPAPPGSSSGNPPPPLFPPIFVQDLPSYTNLIEDSAPFELDLTPYATDSPNDPSFTPQNQLVWTVSGFTASIIEVVILNGHIARFIPKPNGYGETQAVFTVRDSTGLTASRTTALRLSNVPDPPLITSTPVTQASANSGYSYTVTAVDPDGDTITFALTERPAGMTIDANSGVISWTAQGAGQYGVTVRAQDSTGRITLQSFTISVS